MLDLGGMKRRRGQALFVLFAIGALYLLVLVALGVKEYGRGPNPMQNSITVTGEGEAVAIPDTAVFSFSITEEAKTVAEAQELCTEEVAEVMEFQSSVISSVVLLTANQKSVATKYPKRRQ